MVYCVKCKTPNPPTEAVCKQCGADLLPGTSLGERLGMLGVMLALAVVGGVLAVAGFRSESLVCLGLGGLAALSGVALLVFGIAYAVGKTPVHERHLLRARRHLDLDPQQAIDDFTRALELTPQALDTVRRSILKERGALYQKLGRTAEAQADLQLLIDQTTQALDKASPADKVKLLKERADLYKKLGKECEGTRDRLDATYAAEAAMSNKNYKPGTAVQAGAQVFGVGGGTFNEAYAIESRKQEAKHILGERLALLKAGRIKAIGFCRKCKAVVELDGELRCGTWPKHGKPKEKEMLFVMPEQSEETRQMMEQKYNPPRRR